MECLHAGGCEVKTTTVCTRPVRRPALTKTKASEEDWVEWTVVHLWAYICASALLPRILLMMCILYERPVRNLDNRCTQCRHIADHGPQEGDALFHIVSCLTGLPRSSLVAGERDPWHLVPKSFGLRQPAHAVISTRPWDYSPLHSRTCLTFVTASAATYTLFFG